MVGSIFAQVDQFRIAFNSIYVCRLFDERWTTQRRKGRWTNKTSGGSLVNSGWTKNEQYTLEVKEACELVVTVQQQDRRVALLEEAEQGTPPTELGHYANAIGFAVVAHDFGDGDFRAPLDPLHITLGCTPFDNTNPDNRAPSAQPPPPKPDRYRTVDESSSHDFPARYKG